MFAVTTNGARSLYTTKESDSDLVTAVTTFRTGEMPRNLDADTYLQKTKTLLKVSRILGTGVVYEKPGEEFREIVSLCQLGFIVPQEYQGFKNILLAFEKGFTIDRKTGLFTGEVTDVIEDFPLFDGWYEVEKKTGIPQGREVSHRIASARYLARRKVQIGTIIRGDEHDYLGRRTVGLYGKPETSFRVAQFDAFLRNGSNGAH